MPLPDFHVAEFRRPFGFDRIELGFIRQSFDDRTRRIRRSLGFKGVRPERLLEFHFPVDEWTEGEAKRFLSGFDQNAKRFFRATGAAKMSHFELALSMANKSRLPDTAFLLILAGGDKADGKTEPGSLRRFPIRREDGSLDLPRLGYALSQIPLADLPKATKDKLNGKANKLFESEKERIAGSFDGIKEGEAAVLAVGIPGGMDPAGAPYKDSNGQNCQKYVKEIIRTGDFFKAETAQRFPVDEAKLDHWVQTFEDYTANGNRVPVPNGHDFQGDPDRNRGYCVGMFREGKSLFGVLEMVGDDAIAAASRCDVSIYSPKSFTDSEDNSYLWPIRHIALTTDPVINRLGPFVPVAHEKIAAGRDNGPKKVSLYSLTQGAEIMDWAKLHKQLGITGDTELTADNANELILAFVKDTVGTQVKTQVKAQIDDATKTAVTEAKVEFAASHGDKKEKIPAYAIKAIAKGRKSDLQTLVFGRHITPAVADAMTKRYTSDASIALSHQNGSDEEFDGMIEDLKLNDSKALSELKVENGLVLDRTEPNDDPNQVKAPTAEELKARRDQAFGRTG